ncbi:MAG: hypothetical protein RIB86_02110, partial [Imperialibacter sp.]
MAQKKSKSKNGNDVPEKITLADKGQTLYRIVIPSAATADEQKAASVLQDYLLQISGAVLPIIEADRSRSSHEIVLGQNERLGELGINVDLNELKDDGFLIR